MVSVITFRRAMVEVKQRAIVEVKKRLSVIGWVIKNLSYRAPPFFGSHVKPLVPVALAVIRTTNSHWARVV
jgi:hypothetical protein